MNFSNTAAYFLEKCGNNRYCSTDKCTFGNFYTLFCTTKERYTLTVSKRFAVRAIAFTAAVVAVLGVKAGMYHHRAVESEESLKYSYLSAIEDLSQSADSINSVLEKELYAGL